MSTVPPKSRFQLREKKLDKIEMAPIIDVNNLLLIFFFCIGGKQEKAKQNFSEANEVRLRKFCVAELRGNVKHDCSRRELCSKPA